MALSLFALALGLSIQAAEPPAKGDACALPSGLREAVQQRFGSARVLRSADLFEDERGLFQKEHPGACPGLAHGQFFGPGQRPAIALILLDVEPKKNVRLVVARPALAIWTLVEVDEFDAGTTAVVGKSKPGPKASAGTTAAKPASTDSVSLTSYETWRRLYVWNGRRFDRVPEGD